MMGVFCSSAQKKMLYECRWALRECACQRPPPTNSSMQWSKQSSPTGVGYVFTSPVFFFLIISEWFLRWVLLFAGAPTGERIAICATAVDRNRTCSGFGARPGLHISDLCFPCWELFQGGVCLSCLIFCSDLFIGSEYLFLDIIIIVIFRRVGVLEVLDF